MSAPLILRVCLSKYMEKDKNFAYDSFAIDAKKYTIDEDGFLHLPLTVAKVGIMTYPGEPYERRYMPPEVLQAAVSSLDYAFITKMHEGKMIDVHNRKDHGKGIIKAGSKFDNKYIRANGRVEDPEMVQDILDKRIVEVSAGYKFKIDRKPGQNEYGAFDTSYTAAKYNHVSGLVTSMPARAGRDIKFAIDKKGGNSMADIQKQLSGFRIGDIQILDVKTISFDKESGSAMDAMDGREQKLLVVIRNQNEKINGLEATVTANKESLKQLQTAQDSMINKGDLNAMTAELLDTREASKKIGLDCAGEVDAHIIKQKILEKVLPGSYKALKEKDQLKSKTAVDAAYDACKENLGFNLEVHNTEEALKGNKGHRPVPPGQSKGLLVPNLNTSYYR